MLFAKANVLLLDNSINHKRISKCNLLLWYSILINELKLKLVSHTWNCFDNDSDIGVVLLAFHFCSFIKTISTHSFSWISMDWKSSCRQKCLRHLSSIYECSVKLWMIKSRISTIFPNKISRSNGNLKCQAAFLLSA